mmetsp:Transcript_73263/g.201199  ORF Transcript_73263/g.201199 Transcript_73263/m.201199 type:complete len:272 (+) Transcript_73263:471-1286(+)
MAHELLAPVVLPEGVDISEHADDRLAHLALEQVLERDRVRVGWLDHVEDLVGHVLDSAVGLLADLLELVDDRAEEVAHLEGRQPARLADVEQPAEVGECLGRALVRHRENKIEVRLVVNLRLPKFAVAVGVALLEDALHKLLRQSAAAIVGELRCREHAVLVGVELEVLEVEHLRVLEREPVGAQLARRDIGSAQLEQLVQDRMGEHLAHADATAPLRVEEEEEFAHHRHLVELEELGAELREGRQAGDQVGRPLLQLALGEHPVARAVVR